MRCPRKSAASVIRHIECCHPTAKSDFLARGIVYRPGGCLTDTRLIETIVHPELTDDEESIAASLLWLLKGDAGQRVLIAWAFGC